MLYKEARVYLDAASKYGSVLGLDSIKGLLGELGNPQEDLEFIQIAGTNGKGSILACLSGILQEAGYRVGTYLSPTVLGYLERFQINGTWMAEEELAFFVDPVRRAAERWTAKGHTPPTVFELETAAAFLYFQQRHCDYVVLETGLGGRLDATNVVTTTILSIFASISLDHMAVLGGTLEEIAREKAGILKSGVPAVTSPQPLKALEVLERRAGELGCELRISRPGEALVLEDTLEGQTFSYTAGRPDIHTCSYEGLRLPLLGVHQIENAATVLEAVELLKERGLAIPEQAVRRGLAQAEWPGRFQVLRMEPLLIADGAHNPDAAGRLAQNIRRYLPGRRILAVNGIFRDKDYKGIIREMAPLLDFVYTVDLPDSARTLDKDTLRQAWRSAGVPSQAAASPEEALGQAVAMAAARQEERQEERQSAVLVFGSLSFLGDVIRWAGKTGSVQGPGTT